MITRAPVTVELTVLLDPAYLTREVAEAILDGTPLRLEVRNWRTGPLEYEEAVDQPLRLRLVGVSEGLPTLEPELAAVVSQGYCSHCLMPAERGPSGAWWHVGGSCWGVGHNTSTHFIEGNPT